MKEKTFYEIEYEAWSGRARYYDALFAPISTQAINDILDGFGNLQGKRHLDVACGTGHLVATASRRGAISEGVDFSPAMVTAAQANYPGEHFQTADAANLPYEDSSFDLVTCSFGLLHMENPQAAVNEAFRVLRSGGRFAFTLWYGSEDGNDNHAITEAALAKHGTKDVTLPQKWTQLRNADKQACQLMTEEAGFGSPVFKRLPIVWHAGSAQEVVDILLKLSVRTKMVIDRQPVAAQERIYQQILSEAEARRTNGSIPINWPALLTVVQKPIFEARAKSSRRLEPKHVLFDSIEQMLLPETLSELLSKPVTQVSYSAPSVWGNAGSEFTFVDTNVERLVLKTMSMASDYEMFATGDHLCRSVTLWQYGLLDQVRPHLEHKIIACAHENDVWAILMQDLSGHFLWESEEQAQELLPTFLDALARLHAEFWNDARLHDPRLGLDSPRILFQLTSPDFARQHNSDHWSWIPGGVIGGWEALKELLEPDVMSYMQSLSDNPQPLLDALNRYPHTLLHGDAYKSNLAHKDTGSAVAVDWQLAMRSLMTVDLARIVLDFSMDSTEQARAQAYYRQRLEGYLNQQFRDTEWQAMVDLGILTEVLWITCFPAYFIERPEHQNIRHLCEMRVEACNQQVRDGVRWL